MWLDVTFTPAPSSCDWMVTPGVNGASVGLSNCLPLVVFHAERPLLVTVDLLCSLTTLRRAAGPLRHNPAAPAPSLPPPAWHGPAQHRQQIAMATSPDCRSPQCEVSVSMAMEQMNGNPSLFLHRGNRMGGGRGGGVVSMC